MWERETPTRSASSSCFRPELVQELAEGLAELDRVQVLAVDVLDEGFPEQVGVVGVPQHHGHGGHPGELGRTEPPLPGDDLVAP